MLENGQFPVRLLVSGIMGLLFRSWLDPFVILFTLPLAAIGAIIALLATGTALSISVMIGVLMLVGIVVTNAIVMLEFVAGSQYLRRVGAWRSNTAAANSDDSASHHAGPCDDVFGLVNGALIAADLGRTVVGGLFTSTLLTLVVVPVVYSLVDDLKRRFGHSDDLVVVPESRAPVNQQLAGPETHSSAWLSHRRLPTR